MTCLDCSKRIATALERVEGVSSALVDYRSGSARVELSHVVPAEALVEAVERAGYEAEIAPGAFIAASASGADSPDVASRSSAKPGPSQRTRTAAAREAHSPDGARDFDVLVIGTGGAGVAAAIQAAGMGGKVGITEVGTLGGTCVNVGCIPSKNLIEAAGHVHKARKGFPGIAPCEPAVDWREILRQKNALVTGLRQSRYSDVLASYPGITLLHGRARISKSANGSLTVNVGDHAHRARKVIVATGTSPVLPPIPGLSDVATLDSTSAMELETLPRSLVVLGGSAVGLELGQMFARLGVKVTVIELTPRLLPGEDEAVSEALRSFLEAEGLDIHTGATTTRFERDGAGVAARMTQGTLEGVLRAERILLATGRHANTQDVGLEELGVRLNEKGFVRVDGTMRTSNPDIYAAGDVTGGPGYVYVAATGGRIAAENAMRALSPGKENVNPDPRELDLSAVPNVTFTDPQVGSVGLTESKANAAGYNVQTTMLMMELVPRALVSGDTRGFVKVVAEAGSGKLLGFHAIAPNAGELLGEATLAIRFGLTARDIAGTLHPYLTWGESLKLAAQGFTMDVSKLSCCA